MVSEKGLLPIDQKRAQNFFKHYDLQRIVGKENETVGQSESPQYCRFCDRTEDQDEVKFNTEAHLIPELLGNERVFTNEECDDCNSHHSRYETSLGDYTLPIRALLGLEGKRGFPTHKDRPRNEDLRVEHKDGELFIEVETESDFIDIDQEDETLTVKTERPPHRPLQVFKSLSKIALSLIEREEVSNFKIYRDLLESDDYDERVKGNDLFSLFGYWFPGTPGVAHPLAALYTCTSDQTPPSHPSKVLVLQFANQLWQVPFISLEDNQALALAQQRATNSGKAPPSFSMPQYPAPISSFSTLKFGGYGAYQDDLSDPELRRNHRFTTKFSYEAVKRGSLDDFDM